MSAPAFTPGPWGRIRDNHFRVEQDDTGYTSWIPLGPNKGLTVAMAVTDGDCDDDETDANGFLIAAAPELYAALEHILNGALSLPRFAEEEGRAALAKARGEQ